MVSLRSMYEGSQWCSSIGDNRTVCYVRSYHTSVSSSRPDNVDLVLSDVTVDKMVRAIVEPAKLLPVRERMLTWCWNGQVMSENTVFDQILNERTTAVDG